MDPRARPALLSLVLVLGCGTETFSNQPSRAGDAASDGSDGANDASADGAVPLTDAGGDAPIATGGKFFCQRFDDGPDLECALGTEVCCYVEGDTPNFCVPTGDTCARAGGLARPYGCLTQNHCAAMGRAGNVCCAFQDSTGSYVTSVACVPAEQCVSPHLLACGTVTDCTSNTTCQPHNPLLSVCK